MNKEELLPFELEKAINGWPAVYKIGSNLYDILYISKNGEGIDVLIRRGSLTLHYLTPDDIREFIFLKPKKDPQFGDRIMVKDIKKENWFGPKIFLWMNKTSHVVAMDEDDFNILNEYPAATYEECVLDTYVHWKWPEQEEKEPELKEINFIVDPQNFGEVGEKLNDLIFAVNKSIKERNERI